MSKIKICGLRRTEDIDYVNEFKPDYAGFIYVPGRTRNVEPELGKMLRAELDPHIKAVGVFINEDREKIASYFDKGLFDIIQLHGQEPEEDELPYEELQTAVAAESRPRSRHGRERPETTDEFRPIRPVRAYPESDLEKTSMFGLFDDPYDDK